MVRAVSTLRRFPRFLLVVLAAVQASCLPFAQNQGDYVIVPTEVMRDECGLLSEIQDDLTLSMQITGRVVRFDFGVQNMQLIGYFLEEGEDFTADGNAANVTIDVQGQECLLDQMNVHLDGTTRCATQFDGVLRLAYESERLERCSCELWLRYEAVQEGERCVTEP